jgi:hypothetical protein
MKARLYRLFRVIGHHGGHGAWSSGRTSRVVGLQRLVGNQAHTHRLPIETGVCRPLQPFFVGRPGVVLPRCYPGATPGGFVGRYDRPARWEGAWV